MIPKKKIAPEKGNGKKSVRKSTLYASNEAFLFGTCLGAFSQKCISFKANIIFGRTSLSKK